MHFAAPRAQGAEWVHGVRLQHVPVADDEIGVPADLEVMDRNDKTLNFASLSFQSPGSMPVRSLCGQGAERSVELKGVIALANGRAAERWDRRSPQVQRSAAGVRPTWFVRLARGDPRRFVDDPVLTD